MRKNYKIEEPECIPLKDLWKDLRAIAKLEAINFPGSSEDLCIRRDSIYELYLEGLNLEDFVFVIDCEKKFYSRAKVVGTFLEELSSKEVEGIILSKNLFEKWKDIFTNFTFPIFSTSLPKKDFVRTLQNYIDFRFAPYTYVHGSCVEVFGEGVLIIGKAGTGKSECVYELLRRGHYFVGDDLIKLIAYPFNTITATSGALNKRMKTFIELRYVGLLDLEMTFGPSNMKDKTEVSMVVELSDEEVKLREESTFSILGIEVPKIIIPSAEKGLIPSRIERSILKLKLKKFANFDANKIFHEILKEEHDKETA